jgi:hypothetical protein
MLNKPFFVIYFLCIILLHLLHLLPSNSLSIFSSFPPIIFPLFSSSFRCVTFCRLHGIPLIFCNFRISCICKLLCLVSIYIFILIFNLFISFHYHCFHLFYLFHHLLILFFQVFVLFSSFTSFSSSVP